MFLLWVGVFIPVLKNSAMAAYMLLYLILLELLLYCLLGGQEIFYSDYCGIVIFKQFFHDKTCDE